MRGKWMERYVDVVGELAWMGMLLAAALICPFPSARHLVEIGVTGWVGWRLVTWLPGSLKRSDVVATLGLKDPVAEINAIVDGLWGDSDTEVKGDK